MNAAERVVGEDTLAGLLTRFLDALHLAARGEGPWTPVLTSLLALGGGGASAAARRPLFEAALRHVRHALEVTPAPDSGRAPRPCALPCGLAVVDARGEVLFASERASAMLRGRRGAESREGGEPRSLRGLGGGRFLAALHSARRRTEGATDACLLLEAEPPAPALRLLLLRAAPQPAPAPARGATLVLLFEQCAEAGPGLLREVYGFSAAEAALTGLLLAGHDLATAARSRGVSLNTVRSQLRSVLRKTGCRNQGDLVRTLVTGPAGLLLPLCPPRPGAR